MFTVFDWGGAAGRDRRPSVAGSEIAGHGSPCWVYGWSDSPEVAKMKTTPGARIVGEHDNPEEIEDRARQEGVTAWFVGGTRHQITDYRDPTRK